MDCSALDPVLLLFFNKELKTFFEKNGTVNAALVWYMGCCSSKNKNYKEQCLIVL